MFRAETSLAASSIMEIHCYNPICLTGLAMKNCDHQDCIDQLWYPALLKRNSEGNLDSYYCTRECKANVVMTDYKEETKPRSVAEMKFRLNRMKERVIEDKKGQKQLL